MKKFTKAIATFTSTIMLSAALVAPVSAAEINISNSNFQSIWNKVHNMIEETKTKASPTNETTVTPEQSPEVKPTPAPAKPTPAPEVKPAPAPVKPTPAPEVKPAPAPVKPTPAPEVKPDPAPVKPTPAPEVKPAPAPVKPTPAPEVKPTPAPVKPTPAPAEKDNSGYQISAFEKRVVELVNIERQKEGLKPLVADPTLGKGARAKSQDMVDNNYFSHTSPTYGSPFAMMKTFGVKYSNAGENIASGQRTPESVVNAWMNSPGHRANIMSAKYGKIGVGYAYKSSGNYHHYWTQWFTN